MNPFLLPPQERLSAWRAFREEITGIGDMEQLSQVASWVAQAPTSKFVLDYDDADNWPGPWQLICDGDFDDVALAYLMEQTLLTLGWNPERMRLIMIRNTQESLQSMVLLVDNKWVLNYQHAEVFNFDTERQNCVTLVSYRVNPEGGHLRV